MKKKKIDFLKMLDRAPPLSENFAQFFTVICDY